MKQLLTSLLLILAAAAQATTYYVSNIGNTTNNGTSTATPWSYDKLQTELAKPSGSVIVPGDVVLLNRGEVFYGALTAGRSGTSSAYYTIGAYGTGAKPVITGFTTLTAWTAVGGGIYETTTGFSGLNSCWMVTVNGKPYPIARYPNASTSSTTNYGYLKAEATAGAKNQVIDSLADLPLSPSMVGAMVVSKGERWSLDTATVAAHTAKPYAEGMPNGYSVLTLTNDLVYTHRKGWGYFFQNRPEFIDQNYEWHYNPATGKLRIMLPSAPANYTIKAATVENLVTMVSKSYYKFDNVKFEGSNNRGVFLDGSASFIDFTGCDWQYIGTKGIGADNNSSTSSSASNVSVLNCTLQDVNSMGIDFAGAGSGWNVTGTLVKRIGINTGMYATQQGGQCATGIRAGSGTHYFGYNTYDSTGSISIRWHGSGTIVEKSIFTNFCLTSDDNGAIYCSNATSRAGSEVRYNLVIGGRAGQPFAGTTSTSYQVYGIYLDDGTNSGDGLNPVKVHHNIVMNNSWGGIYLHNTYGIAVYDNYGFYNERHQFQTVNDRNAVGPSAVNTSTADDTTGMLTIKRNVFVSKKTSDYIVRFQTLHADTAYLRKLDEPSPSGRHTNLYNGIDSNWYMRPVDESGGYIWTTSNLYGSGDNITKEVRKYQSLLQWTAYSSHDAHSLGSPVLFTATDNMDSVVRLVYNYTDRDSTVTLSRSWKGHDGSIYYPGTVTLDPWTALVLLKFDAVKPPDPEPPVPPVVIGNNPVIGYAGYQVLIKNGKAIKYNGKLLVRRIPVYKQNLLTWSEELDNAVWLKTSGISVAANATAAPDGTITAERASTIVGGATSKAVYQAGATVKDSVYTLSVYAKNVDRRYLQVYFGASGFGTTAYANFDLQEGTRTLAGTGILESGIEPVAGAAGWYLCWITAKATATAGSGVNNSFGLIYTPTISRAPSYTSSIITSIDLWGAQYAKNKPRPYSKTTDAAIQ